MPLSFLPEDYSQRGVEFQLRAAVTDMATGQECATAKSPRLDFTVARRESKKAALR